MITEANDEGRMLSLQNLFEHIHENHKIIKSLFVAESMEMFRVKAVAYWRGAIQDFLESRQSEKRNMANKSSKANKSSESGKDSDVDEPVDIVIPADILANHIAMTLINMIELCMGKNLKYTAKEMDGFFSSNDQPTIERILIVYAN